MDGEGKSRGALNVVGVVCDVNKHRCLNDSVLGNVRREIRSLDSFVKEVAGGSSVHIARLNAHKMANRTIINIIIIPKMLLHPHICFTKKR